MSTTAEDEEPLLNPPQGDYGILDDDEDDDEELGGIAVNAPLGGSSSRMGSSTSDEAIALRRVSPANTVTASSSSTNQFRYAMTLGSITRSNDPSGGGRTRTTTSMVETGSVVEVSRAIVDEYIEEGDGGDGSARYEDEDEDEGEDENDEEEDDGGENTKKKKKKKRGVRFGVPRSLHYRTVPAQRVADVLKEYEERRTQKPKNPIIYLKNYYKILLLVGIFYSLPSIQFVIFQYEKKEEASIDCYFNFKCAKPLLGFDAFNNIVSNVGYLLAGLLFWAVVWMTKLERMQLARVGAGYGLHDDRSLYYCIALAICFEGIFSGLYHVCPSRINFQFDTTFMIIGSGLLFVTLFQKRHPASAPGAVRVFVFFAIIVFLNFLALSRIPTAALWAIVFVVLGITTLLGSVHIYNHKKLPYKQVLYNITHFWPISEPGRLIMILIANGLSGAMLVVSAVSSIREDNTENFPTLMLGLFVLNTFIYMLYYLLMKLRNREKVHWAVWILFVAVIGFWSAGLYFFEVGVTNKFLPPEESRKLNKPCIVFDYFDDHDVWHFLSAAGLVAISLLVYILDFGLTATHATLPLF